MTMQSTADDAAVMDLQRPVPEGYKELVKTFIELKSQGGRFSKRFYWNAGRHVSKIKEDAHGKKYGRKTLEHFAKDVDHDQGVLYGYAVVYEAYADDKAFARVLSRSKVSASMLVPLSWLPDDTQRDQVERRVQNAKKSMTYKDVKKLVKTMMGKKTNNVDDRTENPVTLCKRLYDKLERGIEKIREPLKEVARVENALKKAKDGGQDVPAEVLKRRKETLASIKKLIKDSQKYVDFAEKHVI